MTSWAEEEVKTAALGDQRLSKRLVKVLDHLGLVWSSISSGAVSKSSCMMSGNEFPHYLMTGKPHFPHQDLSL